MIEFKYKKLLITSLCILFTVMSVFFVVMSDNVLHNDSCKEQNCPICIFIVMAENFVKNTIVMGINFILINNAIFLIKLIMENINRIRRLTLVELKVIQIK